MVWSHYRSSFLGSVTLLLWGLGSHAVKAQRVVATGSVRGRVVDLQTGEPIAKATVSVIGQTTNAATDDEGRFTLGAVPAGTLDLRISAVGYGLLKKRADVAAGATVELDVRLGQEALRDSEQITVVAGPFEPVVADAVTQYSLNNTELQDLSTVLANDPLRAVASLPGVSSDQDFYADFAVRGAGLRHIGVYIDGVLVDDPTYSLEDSGDIGSLSVVNGDVVRSVSLLSGSFPASYGERTGAILAVATRDGARDRVATRFTADMLGAILTSEGPLGKAKKASWLVSGRQSYLAYLQDRLGAAGALTLNYNDATGKLVYDFSPHHKFSFFDSFGSTGASKSPIYAAGEAANFFTTGAAQHGMSIVHWDWIVSPETLLQSQGFWTHDHEHDTNLNSAVNLDTTSNVYGLREDFTRQFGKLNKVEAGAEARSPHQQRDSFTQWNFATDTLSSTLLPFDKYSRSEWQTGGYVQDALTLLKNRLVVGAGGRWQYATPSSQGVWLPHASAMFAATHSTNVSLAYGQYAQSPSLLQLYGAFGTTSLRAERATHETVAVDQFLTEKLRLHAELYNRQEHEDIYSPETEFRLLPGNQVGFPVLGPVLGNNLDAYARGFEVSMQRRSANRLSGWIAYSRSYSKYWQPTTTLSFQGDYDQRNTFSAYAAYRITRTIDVSGHTRYGSGVPIPGFLAPFITLPSGASGVVYQLSQARNTLRTDDYERSDIRVNKVFNARRFNLTVHGEIENLTGHMNYVYYDFIYPGNVGEYHSVFATRGTTLPVLPVAGLTLEF
jgi:hypothetical protein